MNSPSYRTSPATPVAVFDAGAAAERIRLLGVTAPLNAIAPFVAPMVVDVDAVNALIVVGELNTFALDADVATVPSHVSDPVNTRFPLPSSVILVVS